MLPLKVLLSDISNQLLSKKYCDPADAEALTSQDLKWNTEFSVLYFDFLCPNFKIHTAA